MLKAFGWLARFKGLRGGVFDVFGYSHERKMERQLLADYETVLDEIAAELSQQNHQTAIELARYPDLIRGFGHVKERNVAKAKGERMRLRAGLKNAGGLEELQAAE